MYVASAQKARSRTSSGFKHPRRRWGRLCGISISLVALWLLLAELSKLHSDMPTTLVISARSRMIQQRSSYSAEDNLREADKLSILSNEDEPKTTPNESDLFETTKIKTSEDNLKSTADLQGTVEIIPMVNAKEASLEIETADDEEDVEEAGLKRIRVKEGDIQEQPRSPVDNTVNLDGRPGAAEPQQPLGLNERVRFPTYLEFEAQDARADTLPDLVYTSFEDATADIELQGWEDEWMSDARYNSLTWGLLDEPEIDFVYTWVNGSEKSFIDTIRPYELNSSLNEPDGEWLTSHKINRYRDWDELRFSIRTVEKFAASFKGKIMLLVNSVGAEGEAQDATLDRPAIIAGRQSPLWLKDDEVTRQAVQVIPQEELFNQDEAGCLPTFDSLTIENQIYNTISSTDRFFALSDDMFLGKVHAASDLYSPLFGPTMGFKTNAYNTKSPPTDMDARRFGEKPFLIYTSWLLNRRFGERKRKGQVHFGHSMSRSVTREAIRSFPRPALQSTCQRFRGETGFQLYSWYATFHYTIERHREVLLWSYILVRADLNGDGVLDWTERQAVISDLERGLANEANKTFRERLYYQLPDQLERAGLLPPKVNLDTLWTSLDGPIMIKDSECFQFDVNECMAPGFSTPLSDMNNTTPVFSTALIFDRLARQHPLCGDCLIKLVLNQVPRGLSPLLPHSNTQAQQRSTVIKSLLKYHYTIVEPDALFVMVTDSEQVEEVLMKHFLKHKKEVGQICLNDDVSSADDSALEKLKQTMQDFFEQIAPDKTVFEQ